MTPHIDLTAVLGAALSNVRAVGLLVLGVVVSIARIFWIRRVLTARQIEKQANDDAWEEHKARRREHARDRARGR
ncbi:hypothetical protein [Collimonas fungivorans]|uniref:hypothetical protein n=1 Tax=Collimonas fungivorans TaxID=158899 RepID=UPI0011D21085|nr:hypothetical protein [Collimonas fungivorans]